MADYYQTLGVSKNAGADEIKAAYRKQALKWHPDRNKSSEAAAKFKEINQAFEVLSDPKKKETYDQYGHDAFQRGGFGRASGGQTGSYSQGPFSYTYTTNGGEGFPFGEADFGGFSDPFEIFEQFFGFQSPFSQGRRQSRREIYEIRITFDEAVHGVSRDTVIKGERKSIKIPAGVADGNHIRFSDFDLLVHVGKSPDFKREGQDLYLEIEISYSRAVLGGIIEVPTINGPIKLKIKSGTKSGSAIRLKGQGVPYPNSSRTGDQYVVFNIKIPQKLSSHAKRILEELDKELT